MNSILGQFFVATCFVNMGQCPATLWTEGLGFYVLKAFYVLVQVSMAIKLYFLNMCCHTSPRWFSICLCLRNPCCRVLGKKKLVLYLLSIVVDSAVWGSINDRMKSFITGASSCATFKLIGMCCYSTQLQLKFSVTILELELSHLCFICPPWYIELRLK